MGETNCQCAVHNPNAERGASHPPVANVNTILCTACLGSQSCVDATEKVYSMEEDLADV